MNQSSIFFSKTYLIWYVANLHPRHLKCKPFAESGLHRKQEGEYDRVLVLFRHGFWSSCLKNSSITWKDGKYIISTDTNIYSVLRLRWTGNASCFSPSCHFFRTCSRISFSETAEIVSYAGVQNDASTSVKLFQSDPGVWSLSSACKDNVSLYTDAFCMWVLVPVVVSVTWSMSVSMSSESKRCCRR